MGSLLQVSNKSTTVNLFIRHITVVLIPRYLGFQFVDNIFSPEHTHLAQIYKPWGRVLLVTDSTVNSFYASAWEAYFKHHKIPLTTFVMAGGEKNKTMKTMLSIVDAMNDFGLVRKEPVLVVGGGLCTDVTGYACASYRRTSNFIRVPTTLIGLIDASVSIKGALISYHLSFRISLTNLLDSRHQPWKSQEPTWSLSCSSHDFP